MRKTIGLVLAIAMMAMPAYASVVFSDDFEGETIGAAPSNWTVSSPWASFETGSDGVPGKDAVAAIWNGSYTIDSNATFDAPNADLMSWTLSFDQQNFQKWADWNYADIVRTPGNFLLKKDQYRSVLVYNSDGTLLGETADGLGSNQVWTHYTIAYAAATGTLTVSATNANGTTSGTFAGATPNFASHDRISFGVASAPDTQWTKIDNVVVDVVPEPATLALLAAGGVMMRRRTR